MFEAMVARIGYSVYGMSYSFKAVLIGLMAVAQI